MSAGDPIPRARALTVALDLLARLEGTYRRAAVAGSLRRGKAEVGDIELVLAPLYDGAMNRVEQRFAQLLGLHVVEQRLKRDGSRLAWGQPGKSSRYKAMTFLGLPVDVFIVLPDRQWGPTMLLRTGPGRANKALVAAAGTRTDEGDAGVLPPGVRFDDGALWHDGRRLDTPEEEDVFAACGLPYFAPPERSAARYADAASWRAGDERDFHVRVAGGQAADVPFYGHGTRARSDGIWNADGKVTFLDPAIARPTVHYGQSAPVEQADLFADFA